MKSSVALLLIGLTGLALVCVMGCDEFAHGSITGRVVSAIDGTPIAGAIVGVASEGGVTNADGTYGVSGIRTGRRQLVVKATGWVFPDEVMIITIFEGNQNLPDIGLVPATDAPPGAPIIP